MLSRRSIVSFLLAIALLEPGAGLLAEDLAPLPALETDFAALQTNSPFRRSLNLSDSLILTGIANIEGNLFATLLDRKSKETHIVSGAANAQGWRMVGVAGSQSELESMTAQISLAGGEVFSVRFDEQQLKPGEAKPGGGSNGGSGSSGDSNSERRDYREGITGDGHRGPPPPQLVAKLSKLSEETRNMLVDKIREIRDKKPELSSEDRQVIFDNMVDRALQEKR